MLYRDLLDHGGRGGKPLGVASVQWVHRVLHKAFDDAVRDGLLFVNPLDRVKRPVADRRSEIRTWSAVDALKFLAAIQTDRLYAMWFLFLTTGMRRGEVAGPRWSDVNLDSGFIAARSQRTTVNHEVVVNDPKTLGFRAPVAVDTDVIDALRMHRRQRQEERRLPGDGWQDSGLLFVWLNGRPYHPHYHPAVPATVGGGGRPGRDASRFASHVCFVAGRRRDSAEGGARPPAPRFVFHHRAARLTGRPGLAGRPR